MKKQTAGFSKTSVTIYQSTRRHTTDYLNL